MLAEAVTRVQAKVDPLGWAPAVSAMLRRAASHPNLGASAAFRFAVDSARIPLDTLATTLGVHSTPPTDPRFRDPAWTENPYYFAVERTYELICRFVDELLAAGRGGDIDDRKAELALHVLTDALAPTNFLLTNPTAAMRAFQTGGKSLVRGTRLALADLHERNGFPAKIAGPPLAVGTDLATTPGAVVFRNELIELIQYAPQTDEVHAVPLLASPPWINKYYVMDLSPGRSLIEWAVQHGRTVFAISYRNPDESMRDVTLDDYLESGILTAIRVVQEITGQDAVDVVALCLGGAIATMAAAYLTDDSINSLTLLNTMLDYSKPGDLAAFVDPATLDRLEIRMRERGFLEASDMAMAFDLLRARDLIFRYIPERWLLGEEAGQFDILAWNDDSTRMPAAMHSSYLRRLYDENQLARGEFEIGGRRLQLDRVCVDTYVVGAVNDHIVPWTSSYSTVGLLGGEVRYVLTSGGHIAGVVNPPSPKAWHVVSDTYPADPRAWRATSAKTPGSWWLDWTAWATTRAGALRPRPNRLGSAEHPVLERAPGTYVLS